MNIQIIITISFIMFILGLFGILYAKDIVSVLIASQFIIMSGGVNFISFSQTVYQAPLRGMLFVFLAFMTLYLFLFALVFYLYIHLTHFDSESLLKDFMLYKLNIRDWWGDERG